ncbi:MAG: hypothetical protein O7F12_04360 [Nitrospirae bacterium]|nr:hypothetical protein [Nitrospirota bacterium]
MIPVNSDQTLSLLPVKIIHTKKGVILKRGCTEVQIRGENIGAVIEQIFSISTINRVTKDLLIKSFPPEVQPAVAKLVDLFIERRFLVPHAVGDSQLESHEDSTGIFYWHFDQTKSDVPDRLNAQKITILGVNYISRQLAATLGESGFTQVEVVDEPGLRNLQLINDVQGNQPHQWPSSLSIPLAPKEWEATVDASSLGCIIGTSDFGFAPVLREWNTYCVQQNLRFFPIVLFNMIGQIGPLVIPQETACFECVLVRQHSHLNNPNAKQAVDEVAFDTQSVVGFHPSMASILGNIAAMELTKFYSQAMPLWNVGKLIEVNLLATRMTPRKVLKLPRCLVCSPLQTRSAITPDKPYSHFRFSQAQS